MDNKRHFVLVHGAGSGAWCWYKVATQLKSAGHHVTALDLGGTSMKSAGPDTISTIHDFMRPLTELMASLPRDEKLFRESKLEISMNENYTIGHNSHDRGKIDDYMTEKMYQNCLSEDLELAKMLSKPVRMFMEDLANESFLTEERFGSVERVFVVCGDDKAMEVEFQRRMIDRSPPKAVMLIAEADHMAMLSKPHELCQCFEDIVKNYC